MIAKASAKKQSKAKEASRVFLFKTAQLVQKSAFGSTSLKAGTGVCTPACKNIQKHPPFPAKPKKGAVQKDSGSAENPVRIIAIQRLPSSTRPEKKTGLGGRAQHFYIHLSPGRPTPLPRCTPPPSWTVFTASAPEGAPPPYPLFT